MLILVKGISYNFVKATHNYSCILCFVVNIRTKYPIGEEGHGLNENTLLSTCSRENNLSSDRNI